MDIKQSDYISNADRGLSYGDGFFTTAMIQHEHVQLWDLHLHRLKTCQQRLMFPDIDFEQLTENIQQACKGVQSGVLKVIITRGEGGRGYLPDASAQPQVIIKTSEYPNHYQQYQQSGLIVQHSTIKLGHQPLFAGLKTLNRLEQVMIKIDAQHYDCDDVLVSDIDNNIIETSVGNLIAIKGGQAYTPALNNCGVSGVYLAHLARINNIEPIKLKASDLSQLDALFVCNSLMGCVHVASILDHHYDVSLAKQFKSRLESGLL